VAICSLDKWFVPGPKGDAWRARRCEVKYALTGPEEVADKLSFDVYASNYADVEIDDKGRGQIQEDRRPGACGRS